MFQDHIQVNDVELDVVCSNFGNRILLILTQLQKIGTMVLNHMIIHGIPLETLILETLTSLIVRSPSVCIQLIGL
jgi:hypothetical protein